jgi:hypothetical protein
VSADLATSQAVTLPILGAKGQPIVALIADGQRRKSVRCYSNPSCVFVGLNGEVIELSDTADGDEMLRLDAQQWTEFITGVKAGDFGE